MKVANQSLVLLQERLNFFRIFGTNCNMLINSEWCVVRAEAKRNKKTLKNQSTSLKLSNCTKSFSHCLEILKLSPVYNSL